MKIRSALLLVAVCGFQAHSFADEPNKLDQILEEIRNLNQRMERLEAKVAALSDQESTDEAKAKSEFQTIRVEPLIRPFVPSRFESLPIRPASPKEIEDVMRLQFESPGDLLKGIHQRELRLRQRPFFPEMQQSYRGF